MKVILLSPIIASLFLIINTAVLANTQTILIQSSTVSGITSSGPRFSNSRSGSKQSWGPDSSFCGTCAIPILMNHDNVQ